MSWRVPDWFWILQRRKRRLRTLDMWVDNGPASKGATGKRITPVVQQQVIEYMDGLRRYPFTGDVALDLSFMAEGRNPPTIHKAAKFMLDVLGAARPEVASPRRRSVLYGDDRQVKFLYVQLDQAWGRGSNPDRIRGQSGWTRVTARRVRDVLTDLSDVLNSEALDEDSRISLRRTSDDDEKNPFWHPEFPEDWEPERMVRLDTENPRMHAWTNDFFEFMHREQLQDAVLGVTDATLMRALCRYARAVIDPAPLAEIKAVMPDWFIKVRPGRDDVLSNPLTVALPPLPSRSGTSAFFSAVRERMDEFVQRWPMFVPLVVPVKVTLLVVPPISGKDLDNIALDVLPIVHDVLKPHIEPYLLRPQPPDHTPLPEHIAAIDRLRSLNAQSVTAYQVIELARTTDDPVEGVLRLALGRDSGTSWWSKAANFLDLTTEGIECT